MLTGLLLRPPSSPTSSPFSKGVFAFASKLALLFLPRIRVVVSSPSSVVVVVVVVVVAACRDPSSLVKYVAIGVAYPLPLASFFFLLLLFFICFCFLVDLSGEDVDAFVLPLFVPFFVLDDFSVFFFFSVDGVVNNKTSSSSSSNATSQSSKSNTVFPRTITADDGVVKTLFVLFPPLLSFALLPEPPPPFCSSPAPLRCVVLLNFAQSRSERSDPSSLDEVLLFAVVMISFPFERRLYLPRCFVVVVVVVVKAPDKEDE